MNVVGCGAEGCREAAFAGQSLSLARSTSRKESHSCPAEKRQSGCGTRVSMAARRTGRRARPSHEAVQATHLLLIEPAHDVRL